MAAEFTPGPWGFQSHDFRGHQSEFDFYIIGDLDTGEDGDSVAVGVGMIFGNATAGEIPMANARLVASAPDLLQALIDLLRETDRGQQFCHRECVERAEEAIRKATGGST